jgi:hypothetical protein
MYRDEIWYRKLEEAVVEHRGDFTAKQWSKYRIDHLLRLANHIRGYSDACDACRDYQQVLTRLEEEFQELPESKAQRQYQEAQLAQMAAHFATSHRLVPAGYFLRQWLRRGVLLGVVVSFAAAVLVGNALLLPVGTLAIAAASVLYGMGLDEKVARERRRI